MRHENQTTAPTEEGGKEKYTFPGISYHTYSSLYEALIVIIHYEDEKRNYVLRRVSELKRKRK